MRAGALVIRVAAVSGRVQARYSAAKSGGKASIIGFAELARSNAVDAELVDRSRRAGRCV